MSGACTQTTSFQQGDGLGGPHNFRHLRERSAYGFLPASCRPAGTLRFPPLARAQFRAGDPPSLQISVPRGVQSLRPRSDSRSECDS